MYPGRAPSTVLRAITSAPGRSVSQTPSDQPTVVSPSVPRYRRDPRATESMWRPKERWCDPARGFDCALSASQVLAHVWNPAKLQLAVEVSVIADLMALGSRATRNLRPSFHMPAEKEERRLYPLTSERVENQRSRVRIGAVIEGERDRATRRGKVMQDGAEDGTVSVERPVRGRPRRGKRGGYGEDHAAAERRARTLSYCSSTRYVTRGHEYCWASRRPVLPSRVRSVSSSSRATMASASASRSPHGTISASRPSSTTSRKPRMSEQTTGVSHAIDSSSVMPNDALVVGQAYIGAVRVVARTSLEHGADEADVRVAVGLLVVVLAKRTVADDDELRLAPRLPRSRAGTNR